MLCIERPLEKNKYVMPDEIPKHLYSRCEVNHNIKLESKPPLFSPYLMVPPELEELRKQLKELLDIGHICSLKAPFGIPVLFQNKKNGSFCICIDYQALNNVTVKNKYPIPLIADYLIDLVKPSTLPRWIIAKATTKFVLHKRMN